MKYAALVLAFVAGTIACADEGSEGTVVATAARYQVTAHASPLDTTVPGSLRIRVETRNGWHVTAEAPARLDWSGTPELRFELSAVPGALRDLMWELGLRSD